MEIAAPALSSLEDDRRSLTYHATVWGDYFLSYGSEMMNADDGKLETLKEHVRKLLDATPNNSLHKLELIDTVQRLGVGYHFQNEIEGSLKEVYDAYAKGGFNDGNDLHVVALRFRLLRNQRFNVPSNVFEKFMDKEGRFEESLANDVQGVLSLYEASHYSVRGEKILDAALEFSSTHLAAVVSHIGDALLAARVKEALETPIHKCLNRLHATKFIPIYQGYESHDVSLLALAKMDFNLVQKLHQKEISDLTKWWKDLDFGNKFPFVRDRMVECYFWIMQLFFEPRFHVGRMTLSKVLMMITIIDDIYDVHGTLDELQVFTKAIDRWEPAAMEGLPPYMTSCYELLLEVYDEMAELVRADGEYRTSYAKDEMKKLSRVYFEEAVRLFKSETPTLEEYFRVGVPSLGYMIVAVTCFVGMGDLVGKEDFDWVANEPKIVCASSLIGRLMDDMAGYQLEKKQSSVHVYMSEKGATKEETFVALKEKVWTAWQDINEECLNLKGLPMAVVECLVNSARTFHLIYRDGDGFTDSQSKVKDAIKASLVHPMTL
ncbi:beta-caryophyllene synthase-like [Andrographis paniculata]|uniref:beta-caryophyllene synthase-like n=1 Tax=Andrographis paniculata TaxID=175694 RepID=UPI0021E8FD7F|nr:beta-caryophyllene synthase-like [Andrographis paniculata]QJA18345.1 terpene synthase 30 [Andrographis paniculata]